MIIQGFQPSGTNQPVTSQPAPRTALGWGPVRVPAHLMAAGGHPGAKHVGGTPPARNDGGAGDNHTLGNGHISIGVKNVGAELTSIRSEKTGLEYLWQGDPAFWGKHAPVLFPIVGRLKGDTYIYKGKTYSMKQHGLARTRRFELVAKTDDSITLALRHDEETLQHYPFNFELLIRYTLDNSVVRVRYEVRNLGDEPMPFSIGAHPGFRCPLLPGESYEDYAIEFNSSAAVDRHFLDDGLIASRTEPLPADGNKLRLSRGMFDEDAIVLKDSDFLRATLANKKTGHGVTMHMAGFPYFGIWAKPGADFVCLEPWFGIADGVDSNQRFEDKAGIIMLQGKGAFVAAYGISPH